MRFLGILATVGLLAGAFAIEETELPEPGHPHGSRHVEDASEGHHHGDSDDHHESPNSPCHHHEMHACSGHGPDLAPPLLSSLFEPGLERRYTICTVLPVEPPSLQLVWHIPI